MPAYNEEGAIAEAVAEVRQWVLDRVPGSELVVVNDGSRDRTGELLDAIAAQDSRVRVIHKKNGGHGPALRTGLDMARGDALFLIDSDRQIPLDAFGPLWQAVESGRDGAFGIRAHRDDPALRLWLTKVIRNALTLMFGVRLRDANVPYKIFRRRLWEEAKPLIPPDTLAPSLFLAVYAAKKQFDVATFPIPHRERQTGEVSIRRWKLLKFCARAFGQLREFRSKLARA
jgi:glycosyltransferase involved in cell wall biosynthesis